MLSRLGSIGFALPALALALAGLAVVAAAENIDPAGDGSQYAWGENVGWINAEPSNCSGCGVQVSTPDVTGWMWGENIGWINMSCRNNYGASCTGSPGGTWGVTNDGAGNLAGYAWGENVGWISFSCTNNGTCGTVNYGVAIDGPSGIFSGYAWGENIGWIRFSDSAPVDYQVQTSDADGDGIAGGLEITCGSDPGNSGLRPERIDGAFAGVDDDGDTQVDEALPGGAANFDCDGDGYKGSAEAAIYAPSTLGDQDPCGTDAWPSDFVSGGIFGSTNRVLIDDLNTFLSPRKLDLNLTGAGDPNKRWDLSPGPGIFATDINIADLNALLGGATAFPPMLGGERALGGPPCPWPGVVE